jgi:Fe-S-cluster containining protein
MPAPDPLSAAKFNATREVRKIYADLAARPLERSCALLDTKTSRCLIYESRPLGCRTHFCAAAGGPYPRTHVLDLIRRLEEIDQDLGGDGSHPIEKSITAALSDF